MNNTPKPPATVTPISKKRRKDPALLRWVPTKSAERVLRVLNFAFEHGDMGVVCGVPGIGKTRTATHFASEHPDSVWVATMTPASAALVPALEAVAERVGVHETLSGARRISASIRAHIGRGAGRLLVIDEAQHLSMVAVEELRQIHDATGCGLVFMGNDTVYERFSGKMKWAKYAQISSRVGIKVELKRPTAGDIDALCRAWGIEDADAMEMIASQAARPGALRGVVKVLQLARSNGAAVTADALAAAIDLLDAEV